MMGKSWFFIGMFRFLVHSVDFADPGH